MLLLSWLTLIAFALSVFLLIMSFLLEDFNWHQRYIGGLSLVALAAIMISPPLWVISYKAFIISSIALLNYITFLFSINLEDSDQIVSIVSLMVGAYIALMLYPGTVITFGNVIAGFFSSTIFVAFGVLLFALPKIKINEEDEVSESSWGIFKFAPLFLLGLTSGIYIYYNYYEQTVILIKYLLSKPILLEFFLAIIFIFILSAILCTKEFQVPTAVFMLSLCASLLFCTYFAPLSGMLHIAIVACVPSIATLVAVPLTKNEVKGSNYDSDFDSDFDLGF